MTTLRFPPTAEHAAARLAAEPAVVRAGATDLQERRHLGLESASTLVDLSRAEALRQLTRTEAGGLRIGAMVRIATLAEHAAADMTWGEFHEATLEAMRLDAQIVRVATEITRKQMEMDRLREKRDALLMPLTMRVARLAQDERQKQS